MKKAKLIILNFAILLALLILQIYIIDTKTLFGIKPNILLVTVIIANLWGDSKYSIIYSLLLGIFFDIMYGNDFGIFTISYTIVACIISIINNGYKKQGRGSAMYITFLGTTIFEGFQYIVYLILLKGTFSISFAITTVIISSLLNIAIMLILYKLFLKMYEEISGDIKIY